MQVTISVLVEESLQSRGDLHVAGSFHEVLGPRILDLRQCCNEVSKQLAYQDGLASIFENCLSFHYKMINEVKLILYCSFLLQL